MSNREATFGAGCFWGVEQTFRNTPGVIDTSVGYSGGYTENPTYEQVCSKATGHAEVVRVIFDDEKITYEALLDVFFNLHDPTSEMKLGYKGLGQYRSVIFTHSAEQQSAAEAAKQALGESGAYSGPLLTQIEPAGEYYLAEEYHQQYLAKNGLSNCH